MKAHRVSLGPRLRLELSHGVEALAGDFRLKAPLRAILCGLLSLIAAFGVSCGRPSPVPAPSVEPSPQLSPTRVSSTPEPSHLVLWEGFDPAQEEWLKEEVAAFQKAEPNIKVEVLHYAGGDELIERVNGGEAEFDLALSPAALVESLRAEGLIRPAGDVFEETFLDGFAQPSVEGVSRGDEIWGVPFSAGLHLLLYYNKELVEEPPQDTAALIVMAQELTGGERYGLAMNYRDPLWLVPWLSGFGGWLVDEEGQPTLDTAAMVEALRFLHDLKFEYGVLPPEADYGLADGLFREGKAALLVNGHWALAGYREIEGLGWGVAPLPTVSETGLTPSPLVMGQYFVIGSDVSGQKLERVRFLVEYMTASQRQVEWKRQFDTLPASREALDDESVQSDPLVQVSVAQMLAGRGASLGSNPTMLLEAMREPLEAVMADLMTPTEAARQMQERAESMLKARER
jgi:arabinogalactan oligomer/maltooligosaccharide transport system substrate-binding protein